MKEEKFDTRKLISALEIAVACFESFDKNGELI